MNAPKACGQVNDGIACTLMRPGDEIYCPDCNPREPAIQVRGGWQPIETAPKDGTRILGWCDHKADPYYVEEELGGGVGCLTNYGARVEGLSHVEDGPHVLIWGEAYEVSDGWENPSFMMPAGWELSHDCEVMANPTHWMAIPAPETGEQA